MIGKLVVEDISIEERGGAYCFASATLQAENDNPKEGHFSVRITVPLAAAPDEPLQRLLARYRDELPRLLDMDAVRRLCMPPK